MRNVEVKVRVPALDALESRVRALGADDRGVLRQSDTYFAAPTRLKLRRQQGQAAELIAYARPDRPSLRTSEYHIWRTADGPGLEALLAAALGVRARIVKARRLFVLGRTRIHLDAVEALGHFLELEVVLAEGEDEADARREAEALLSALGLADAERIAGSYADLAPGTVR